MTSMLARMLAWGSLCGLLGVSTDALAGPHFVPNSQEFWDLQGEEGGQPRMLVSGLPGDVSADPDGRPVRSGR